VPSPERLKGISRAGGRASLLAAVLSCGQSVSRSTTSGRLRLTGSAPPPRGRRKSPFGNPRPASRSFTSGVPHRLTGSAAPTDLDPASEYYPGIPVRGNAAHSALSRFRSPSAQPGHPEPPFPGLPHPGSRCVLAVPARLDALLPERPPRCISTGRALGVLPSELHLAAVASSSRRRIPSCDWLSDSREYRSKAKTGFPFPPPSPSLSVRFARTVPVSQAGHGANGFPRPRPRSRGLIPGGKPASKLACSRRASRPDSFR